MIYDAVIKMFRIIRYQLNNLQFGPNVSLQIRPMYVFRFVEEDEDVEKKEPYALSQDLSQNLSQDLSQDKKSDKESHDVPTSGLNKEKSQK